jgi:hypothetical protein
MSNKKWYEKIPDQGAIVKIDTPSLCIAHIAKVSNNGYVIDVFGNNDYNINDLSPITAQDWWQFAPWQPIETAPKKGYFLGISKTNEIQLVEFSTGFRIGNSYFKEECFTDSSGEPFCPEKWLPLP